jgi:hypothetical protein
MGIEKRDIGEASVMYERVHRTRMRMRYAVSDWCQVRPNASTMT